jgi:hypothetical protein
LSAISAVDLGWARTEASRFTPQRGGRAAKFSFAAPVNNRRKQATGGIAGFVFPNTRAGRPDEAAEPLVLEAIGIGRSGGVF